MKSELRIENMFQAYLVKLATVLMTIFSLSLAFPFAYYIDVKYFTKRKYIDGRRLEFSGSLWMIWTIYVIGVVLVLAIVSFTKRLYEDLDIDFLDALWPKILSIITVGLISLLINLQEKRYVQANTHFADQKKERSGYEFHFFWMLWKLIGVKLLKVISAGLLFPISNRIECLYDYKRGYIDNVHFDYQFSFKKMYPRWILDFIFIIITFGLYAPFAFIRIENIDLSFVHIKKDGTK